MVIGNSKQNISSVFADLAKFIIRQLKSTLFFRIFIATKNINYLNAEKN